MRTGIFRVAEQAAKNYKDAEEKELGLLDQFSVELGTNFEYSTTEGVNKPKILDGMTPIKFTTPVGTTKGETVLTNANDTEWYSYANKQWANAQTQDGSMWVWIPRYAYRMVYTNPSDKSAGGTVDVVFLIGETDNYYDANGNIQTAKRAKSVDEVVDTTTGYTVHPAFTDESSINYANGGWDKELTGIWISKFEAAYATEKNVIASKINVASSTNYTHTQVIAHPIEIGKNVEDWADARNYVDGVYGTTVTSIKYPTFQGSSYAMNYISISDAYSLLRVLTKTGTNIYGLTDNNADSHLMKNSEWGAVAYLAKSKYGLEEKNIYINNVNLNNKVTSVYSVTGCCAKNITTNGDNADAGEVTPETVTAIDLNTLEAEIQTVAYTWNQIGGQQASSTGTIYGVYDMSGGSWEYATAYVANGHDYLKSYGASFAYDGNNLKTVSTKYTMVYPHDNTKDYVGSTTDSVTICNANYALNTKIYGDSVREVSKQGVGATTWSGDDSSYNSQFMPFSARGGGYWSTLSAGITSFNATHGAPHYINGFHSVLIAK